MLGEVVAKVLNIGVFRAGLKDVIVPHLGGLVCGRFESLFHPRRMPDVSQLTGIGLHEALPGIQPAGVADPFAHIIGKGRGWRSHQSLSVKTI